MNKQKQIEEMARTFGGCHITPNCKVCCAYSGSTDCPNKTRAEDLYNAGYRKIPEGSVVLTGEELEKYMGCELATLVARSVHLEKQSLNLRKETAEKFAERLKEKCKMDNPLELNVFLINGKTIDEICKEIIGDEK